jgi:hypothetical protein
MNKKTLFTKDDLYNCYLMSCKNRILNEVILKQLLIGTRLGFVV